MMFVLWTLLAGKAMAATLRGGVATVVPQGRPSSGLINSREYHERKRRQQRQRDLALFDWELGPVDGYPIISDQLGEQDIVFLYNFTGDITENARELVIGLFQDDCLTPAPEGANAPLVYNDTILVQELQVDVEMDVDSITDSVFFTYLDTGTSASVSFCLRVDYEYDGEGVNFHETIVNIDIDLTAGFNLTAIAVERLESENNEVEVNIACDVFEYFCNDLFEDIGQPTFSQGDFMQACITSTGYYNIRDVIEADLDQDSDRDGQWDNHDDIVTNFTANPLTDKTCSLGRCKVKTQLRAKYFEERNPNNLTISGVVICGMGKSPTLTFCGGGTKPTVAENSTSVTYPVITALNDVDGTDVWDEIVIEFSTPGGSGQDPVIEFDYTSVDVTYDSSTPNVLRLTGDSDEIEASMRTLKIRPGNSNGEDIFVQITATASSVVNPQVKITNTDSCTIPVDPVVQGGLTVEVPSSVQFNEDTKYTLTGFESVFDGASDVDLSENTMMEILVSSYPVGTRFWANSVRITATNSGWLQIPAEEMAIKFQIRPPSHYSGNFTLSVRSAITDSTSTGNVVLATGTKTVPVSVLPRADGVNFPSVIIGVEDQGPIALGSELDSGIVIKDRGTGTGNNPETETITRIVLDIPEDTADIEYTITGDYAQTTTGSLPGSGGSTATIAFDATLREYTITSTLTEGNDLVGVSQTDRETAMADIRAALATFQVEIGPEHNDANGDIQVHVDTADVNEGVVHEKTDTFSSIVMAAVADLPTVSVVNPAETTSTEDGDSIPLRITVGHSPDRNDDSETLSVRITVPMEDGFPIGTIGGQTPAGVTLTDESGGSYLVTAVGADPDERETLLNSYLSLTGTVEFIPRANWAGSVVDTAGIRIDVISTEDAAVGTNELAGDQYGGADGTSKTETVTAYIGVTVLPVADQATISVKGNSIGFEDTVNEVPIAVSLGDLDGSETYILQITSVTPEGCVLYGAGGMELSPTEGVYTLQPADIEEFAFLPPLHFSTPVQGQVVFETMATITDSAAESTSQSTANLTIPVDIEGIADKPNAKTILVTGSEDTPYDIGSVLDTTGVLVDTDGSETLYMLLQGLPSGTFPTASAGEISYVGGNNRWQVSADALPTLTIPAVDNYSGEDPFPDFTLQAIAQEVDGDEALSDLWTVTFDIYPVVDGITGWGTSASVSEGNNEAGGQGVSLSGAGTYSFLDSDGSEEVIECVFDLTDLIADAQIGVRLENLAGSGTGLSKLVDHYLAGDFVFDSNANTITVAPDKISTVALDAALFLDSNMDFSIPVSIKVRDSIMINGEEQTSEMVQQDTFTVNLVGTADTPTAVAQDTEGNVTSLIPLNLEGTTTDTDVALGRSQSEEIYYFITEISEGSSLPFDYVLVDSGGDVVGHDHGGYWLLYPEHLDDLYIYVPGNESGTLRFRHTTVALENDGDMAMNSDFFTVTVNEGDGLGPDNSTEIPLPPTLQIGSSSGLEDNQLTLVADAFPDPEDPTNPSVTVVISDLPAGASITGAVQNPFTGKWVASAENVRNGNVLVTPPKDFGGDMVFTMEAVSTSSDGYSATTGAESTTAHVDPVADGSGISCTPGSNLEDQTISLAVSLGSLDEDGSEQTGTSLYVKILNNADMVDTYPVVGSGDDDATLGNTTLVGYSRVPVADMNNILLQPTENWHGTISVQVAVPTFEIADDADGDHMTVSTTTHTISVAAVADNAALTVPAATVNGTEDTEISIPDLSAALVDDDGSEQMSVTLSGLPLGSLLSHGQNNGDGSWLVPAENLDQLTVTPPIHFAGTMNLALNAYTMELSNADQETTTEAFTVDVSPVADSFLILADDVSMDTSGKVALDLSLRMLDENGNSADELPAEVVELTFTGLPTGARILPGMGGSLFDGAEGPTFIGSEDQANNLFVVAGPGTNAGSYTVSVSGVTIDSTSRLEDPVVDTFKLTVQQPAVAGQTLSGSTSDDMINGGDGNDVIDGGAGADTITGGSGEDYVTGGPGLDRMTGGGGSDVYSWTVADLGSVDTITDFAAAQGGDILDLHNLWDTSYDLQYDSISSYVQFGGDAGGIVVAIDVTGTGTSFQDLVLLEGVVGISVEAMLANGNIIV